MSDWKRTPEGDIAIENDDLAIVDDIEATAQDIEMTLHTWLGESVYDRLAGMPYEQAIFELGTTPEAVRFIVEQRLLALEGVAEITDLRTQHDTATRDLVIDGKARHVSGEELPFSFSTVTP